MNWDDPLDPVAISVSEVLSGERPILLVRHDAGHGGWQFYDGYDTAGRKPVVAPKPVFLSLDATITALTDLPVGWLARRADAQAPWERSRIVV